MDTIDLDVNTKLDRVDNKLVILQFNIINQRVDEVLLDTELEKKLYEELKQDLLRKEALNNDTYSR